MKSQEHDDELPEDDYASADSEGSEQEDEEEEEDEEQEDEVEHAQEEPKIEYVPIEFETEDLPVSREDLESSDTELWLVRVPRHETLRNTLVGSEIKISEDKGSGATKDAFTSKMAGTLRGSYTFRDHGMLPDPSLRAAFVVNGDNGQAELGVGKPFVKSVSITFDAVMKNLNHIEPPPRKYPSPPDEQKLQFIPIGTKRASKVPATRKKATRSPAGKKQRITK